MPSDYISIIGQPRECEVIQFAVLKNVAAATTRVNFTVPEFQYTSLPVVINTWMTCNSNLGTTQHDVVFKWFGNLFQTLVLSLGGTVEQATATTVHKIAGSICNAHERHCRGMNQQYDGWHALTAS